MVRLSCALLVTACLFVPLPAPAQSYESNESHQISPPNGGPEASSQNLDLDRVTQLVVQYTNAFRKEKGRHELKVNPKLRKAAHSFADFMGRTDKYGHTADGKQPSQRVQDEGYKYCLVAENIAWIYNPQGLSEEGLARQLFEGWKHSPPHRRNMLDHDLIDIGVGVAYSTHSGRYYGVQDFGRPRSRAVRFTVANDSEATVTYTVDGRSYDLPPRYTMTHETCRPPRLELTGVKDEDRGEADREVLHPRNGSHYAIEKDEDGRLHIERQQPANRGG